MNSLDAQIFHKFSPFSFSFWLFTNIEANFMSDVHKGLLDEPTNHAWVRTTAGNSRSFILVLLEMFQKSAPESIVASD